MRHLSVRETIILLENPATGWPDARDPNRSEAEL
jgi:hypothetical protein